MKKGLKVLFSSEYDGIACKHLPRSSYLGTGPSVGGSVNISKTSNRSFPSCLKALFKSEAECKAIEVKIVF